MNRATRLASGLAVLGSLTLGTLTLAQPAGADIRPDGDSGVTVYGLTTDDRIVTFSSDNPRLITNDVFVSGFQNPDEDLIGLDRRPADGRLWGVTQRSDGTRAYTIDPSTGVPSFVAMLVTAPTISNPNRTPIVLSGSEFGVDFNPVADALRIVSDAGQNLRMIPSARTGADGTPLLPGDTFTDLMLNENDVVQTGISAAAYTNNDNDPATATTSLMDIDTEDERLVTQNPPNDGDLTLPLPLTVLGRPARSTVSAGFDIQTVGTDNLGYASLMQEGGRGLTRLFSVNLATGELAKLGVIGQPWVRDIAL
jgi:Domain of unknown function (DUF4394)